MNARQMLAMYERYRGTDAPLVLAAVIATGGSTYSKTGEFMLLDPNADEFMGMLSGGCLEGDLLERARNVLRHSTAEIASYDLSPDDELFGLGVGCDGSMQILLQPLLAANDYAPFAAIADALLGSAEQQITLAPDMAVSITPLPRLLLLGAGLDAEPLVRIAAEVGWQCTVVDHRPAYLDARNFKLAAKTHCLPADSLAQQVDLAGFDMAVIMSHHLASDRSYLRQLSETRIAYVGLLGPPKRRDRLLNDIGPAADRLVGRLRAPVGLNFGGRGPGPIAVEIIAEMQQFLAER